MAIRPERQRIAYSDRVTGEPLTPYVTSAASSLSLPCPSFSYACETVSPSSYSDPTARGAARPCAVPSPGCESRESCGRYTRLHRVGLHHHYRVPDQVRFVFSSLHQVNRSPEFFFAKFAQVMMAAGRSYAIMPSSRRATPGRLRLHRLLEGDSCRTTHTPRRTVPYRSQSSETEAARRRYISFTTR